MRSTKLQGPTTAVLTLLAVLAAPACADVDPESPSEATNATDSPLSTPPTYTAPRLASAPAIDGAVGEYAKLPVISLTSSATVRGGWDATALYLAFDVTDATLLPASGAESGLWNGDGVEVMIDAAKNRSATPDTDDFHLITTSSGLLADARAWTDYSYASGATVRAVPRTGGYRVEMKIPFSKMNLSAREGLQVGFDVAFNDRDVAGGALTSVDFAGLTSFKNPAGWGTLVLGPELSSEPPPPPPPTYGTAYYVRTDGGDAAQCTGKADAAYPGSGTGKACAWKSPAIALPPSGSARIAGGDTLYIASGTYTVGGSSMQPVPSGPAADKRTRILGKTGGPAPKLVGIGGVARVLSLDHANNVEVGNLEITDQSDCVHGHWDAAVKCDTSDAWARTGLYAFASKNVWLHDVNLHGLASRAIQAGGLTDWTIERVKMNKNGRAGFEGTGDAGSSNSGSIVLRDVEIGWNGCGERVATGEPWACWAQAKGGYGDGLGTTETGGQWLVEDAYIHHNTSDGLDLRYMDGADGTKVTVRRLLSVANAGNQAKVRGNSVIENSVLVGDCTYFQGRDYMQSTDLCRAYGSSLLLVLTGNDVAVVRHNTIAGEGDVQIGYAEGGSSDTVKIQNNVIVGFPYFASPSVFSLFHGGNSSIVKSFSGNLGYNVRNCPSGQICNQNPKLTNMTLAAFDGRPLAGSPVIDAAPSLAGVTSDFLEKPRPVGAGPDIGAYEVQ